MAAAWAAFAASGNPSMPELPWAATDPVSNKTMIFDNQCKVVNDPHGEEREALASIRQAAQA